MGGRRGPVPEVNRRRKPCWSSPRGIDTEDVHQEEERISGIDKLKHTHIACLQPMVADELRPPFGTQVCRLVLVEPSPICVPEVLALHVHQAHLHHLGPQCSRQPHKLQRHCLHKFNKSRFNLLLHAEIWKRVSNFGHCNDFSS